MSVTGNHGKFSERIKKISMRRRRKNIKSSQGEYADSRKMYTNFLKVVAAIPGMVYDNVKGNGAHHKNIDMVGKNVEVNDSQNNHYLKTSLNLNDNIVKQNKIDTIKKINVNSIKKAQSLFLSNYDNKIDSMNSNNEKDLFFQSSFADHKRVEKLEKSILDIIKKNLIKTINEMEILQSELYILSEINGDANTVQDVNRQLNEVKKILHRIDTLKEKYDFLKDNYDFEYVLEIDDNSLIDKIIELKNNFDNNEVRAVINDYKLLDTYKYLYLKLDDLQEKTASYENYKNQKIEELKRRDIDFNKFKNNVYNVDKAKSRYDYFVNQQNDLLKEIDSNVSKIDSHEIVSYRLKGFNRLFLSSFKYFGLLVLSPLRGLIPSIATETLITANVLHNMRRNLNWEEHRRTVYEAVDYSLLLKNAIDDLETTSSIVDMTLDDIVRLKMEYNDKFQKYHGDFSDYRETMKKLDYMENQILGNKIKIEIMRKKALEQKKENAKKMVLLHKLNNSQNDSV